MDFSGFVPFSPYNYNRSCMAFFIAWRFKDESGFYERKTNIQTDYFNVSANGYFNGGKRAL